MLTVGGVDVAVRGAGVHALDTVAGATASATILPKTANNFTGAVAASGYVLIGQAQEVPSG